MLRRLLTHSNAINNYFRLFSSINEASNDIVEYQSTSVLEPNENEDISHVSTYLKPTFNFAAYVNKSETLQELLKLGVELYKLEKVEDVPNYILGLNFQNDIQKHVEFLHNLGLKNEEIGSFITRNPLIFKEGLDDLEVRINYLQYKKFTAEMIVRIVTRNPHWLTHTTQQIDEKLGFLQQNFALTGNQVRLVAVKKPKLVTYSRSKIKLNTFAIREEMGFTDEVCKRMLIRRPGIFMKHQVFLLKTFEYLHKTMKVPTDRILKTPEILTCRWLRLKDRHTFLEHLNRAQYDPKLENYVALTALVSGTDAEFCTEIAKSSVQTYNLYLKTL